MKKKIYLLLLAIVASANAIMAQSPGHSGDEGVIVMHEKVVNPAGEHGSMPKSPIMPLYVYKYGNILCFGSDLTGCEVRLVQDETIAFSTFVGTDGTVEIPDNMCGTYELQIVVGEITYAAELTFT